MRKARKYGGVKPHILTEMITCACTMKMGDNAKMGSVNIPDN
jgi:hypothetical protein